MDVLVTSFGRYIKFYVHKESASQCPPSVERPNAFQILMSSQARKSTQTLPSCVAEPRNKKEELHNAIIGFFQAENLAWTPSEVDVGVAATTVKVLTDTLWYIDGHHSKLSERSCDVPVIFQQFKPEMSKHRKRSMSSLSGDLVKSHSQRLFSNLQAGFWDRQRWKAFKQEVELLARNLQKYCDLLNVKKHKMLSNQKCEEQIRSVGNSMTIQVITPHHSVPASVQVLSRIIEETVIDEPISLQEANVLPQDRRKRYDFMEHVKQGLRMPIVLVTYSPGSNMGNQHWIWHTSATDINSALQTCQPIIERIRVMIPQFHTRAMREAAFEKYGLVSSSIKKAILRHMYKDLVGDSSAAVTTSQQEIDDRVSAFFELKEPDLLYDLRETYAGKGSKFDMFWDKTKEFLEEDIGTAVDDRRHSQVVHLAKAVSVRDLREQVMPGRYSYPIGSIHSPTILTFKEEHQGVRAVHRETGNKENGTAAAMAKAPC